MKKLLLSIAAVCAAGMAVAAPVAERLGRGAVALKCSTGVFVSWRSLSADAPDMTFDVYRDGVKVNTAPITAGTNINDLRGTVNSKYTVQAIVDGEAVETVEIPVQPAPYVRVPLQRPASGVSAPGGANQMSSSDYTYTYTPNDCSAGDVDGDGEYEIIVKWDPSNSADNSHRRFTGNVYLDCYKLNGTQLWRIDLGRNIRAGAHYTQFMVYDFDQDGKAELICKTAPGTIDGTGAAVLMNRDSKNADYRVQSGTNTGIIISGPEYLTVFNGETGAAIHSIAYNPPRSKHSSWGDSYGNRSERYLAGVAYLDGQKPSAVFCRGYYTQSYLWAVDFDGSRLTQKWLCESPTAKQGTYGEGAHSLTVGDVDADGCDEIVFGSACVDHNGKLLYRTGFGHGDALHLGDFDPDREGLEVFMVHEETGSAFPWDCEFRDARTGQAIWGVPQSGNDIGRGLVGNLSDTWRGYEVWPGSRYVSGARVNATFDCKGNIAADGKVPGSNFRIYWDGDLLDELFDGRFDSNTGQSAPMVSKRNATLTSDSKTWSFNIYNGQSCNGTKATPCLQADLFGDWREELVLWDGSNSSDLLIFTTTELSKFRIPTLMEDHNYRLAIAWQNTAYNQPPHLGFYLPDRVNGTPELTLTSGALDQTVTAGTPIVAAGGKWKGCLGVGAKGLPDGVTVSVDANAGTWKLEGTPSTAGTYAFTVTTKGGASAAAKQQGTLTVTGSAALETVAVSGAVSHRVVNAVSGIIVAEGEGAPAVSGLVPGVYIVETLTATGRNVSKIVVK